MVETAQQIRDEVLRVPEPAQAAAVDLGTRKVVLALLAGEVASSGACIAQLVCSLGAWDLNGFVGGNLAAIPIRVAITLASWGTGLIAALATLLWTRHFSAAQWSRLAERVRRATPLLVLWCLPGLLSPKSFADSNVAVLGMAALAVAGMELCMRYALTTSNASARISTFWSSRAYLYVALMVSWYIAFAAYGSLALHRKLHTLTFDLGLFENLFWNALHGVHGVTLDQNYFGYHAEPILYLLLPIYALVPRPETLLFVQSVMLATAAVPLYLCAEHWLKDSWQAALLVVAYFFSPLLHGPTFYDFHFLSLSIFFIFWATYCFVSERWRLFWLSVLLALACREDVAIGAVCVGLALAWMGCRTRLGLALAGVAFLWFTGAKFLWLRSVGGEQFVDHYAHLVPTDIYGFGGMLHTLLSNPLYVLRLMFSEQKLALFLYVLVPLAFLPVRRARVLFLLLPGFIVCGLSESDHPIINIHFQYVSHFVSYMFIGAAWVLRTMQPAQRNAALSAMLVGTAIVSAHFGAIFKDPFRANFQSVSFVWSKADAQRLHDLESLVALIPPDAVLAAADHEGSRVARRRYLLDLKDGIFKEGVRTPEYILYGTRSVRWAGIEQVVMALGSGRYGVLAQRGEFTLLKRGAPAAGTPAEAARLSQLLSTPDTIHVF